MKLKTIRVRMFRNILDSTEVAIQPDVTCLVGKNESGKTAFLQALWRLRPARTNPTFSVPDQYPAWLEKRHRLEGQDLNDVRPVEASFAWEPSDQQVVEARFGPGVVPDGSELRIWKSYANKYGWSHGCDERKAVEYLLSRHKLPGKLTGEFKGIETLAALKKKIAEALETHAEVAVSVTALQQLEAARTALVGDESFSDLLWGAVEPRLPQFLYFADYSKLPYTVKIDRVLTAADLNESEATARALLRLGGAEQDYLMNPEYERRKRELENVANTLTDDVLTYWSQNKDLRVQPEVTQRTEQRQDGQHSVLDELKIRIWDNRHSLSLPFDEHSAGFQWFFSFLAAFSEYEHRNPPAVILLDEPAVGLHAKAQADFLRFIRERLAKRSQVIYTTHSPFMVEPGHLERVRMVEDRGKEEGSTVSSDVLSRDPDTLFPLQGALGYDLVQHLFVAEHNLVVEGTSDYTYIRVISDYLASRPGGLSLDPRWSVVPVGGADAVPTFVALLGHHLSVTVVVDSRKEGHQRLNRLAGEGYLAKQRIILIGDVIQQKLADMEDLFSVEEYLRLYNRAFGTSLTQADLSGNDPVVLRIARHIGVDRFDHGKPADILLRERDTILPSLGEGTLKRFEKLFGRINSTL
jgi:AAA domain, putative AbiEii toxin, Type IV TA system/AAA ATPase domain